MHEGRFVFTQLMQHLPMHTFRRLVAKFDGNRYVKRFACLDQDAGLGAILGRCECRDSKGNARQHQHKNQYFEPVADQRPEQVSEVDINIAYWSTYA